VATPINERFKRTQSVNVIGTPEVWYQPHDSRIQYHIYRIAGRDEHALVSMGSGPGVRQGVLGVYTGGSKDDFIDWIESTKRGYKRKG
jgi:hypothetical protein